MRSPCCLSAFESPYLLHAWPSLYETWYVIMAAKADLNGILHKSVCMFILLSLQGVEENIWTEER
jgi:hypothetical protein